MAVNTVCVEIDPHSRTHSRLRNATQYEITVYPAGYVKVILVQAAAIPSLSMKISVDEFTALVRSEQWDQLKAKAMHQASAIEVPNAAGRSL